MEIDRASRTSTGDDALVKAYISLPINYILSLSSFLRSLPAFHSLSHSHRTYLCKTNLRPLILPNSYELSQSCFSDPVQVTSESIRRSTKKSLFFRRSENETHGRWCVAKCCTNAFSELVTSLNRNWSPIRSSHDFGWSCCSFPRPFTPITIRWVTTKAKRNDPLHQRRLRTVTSRCCGNTFFIVMGRSKRFESSPIWFMFSCKWFGLESTSTLVFARSQNICLHTKHWVS